jgi:hypothetical protein
MGTSDDVAMTCRAAKMQPKALAALPRHDGGGRQPFRTGRMRDPLLVGTAGNCGGRGLAGPLG